MVEQDVFVCQVVIAGQILAHIEAEDGAGRGRVGEHHLSWVAVGFLVEEDVLAGQRQRYEAVHLPMVDLCEHAEEVVHRVPRHVVVCRDVRTQVKRPIVDRRIGKAGKLPG